LPFPNGFFDTVYVIEAIVHTPSLASVYTEIFRVLKPGGRFGVFEWVMLAEYFDASNPHHIYLRHGGNGIACIRTSEEAQHAMRSVGFIVERSEDLGNNTDPILRWNICSGSTEFAKT
jgi:sterol 24-C-methyltransferase